MEQYDNENDFELLISDLSDLETAYKYYKKYGHNEELFFELLEKIFEKIQ